ncbi:cytochrome c [Legionella sp. W05-934-2]|jgi:cytochrome c553|uniref:c-type cytochrome n=1 Tax=Legionella sp. W05-934-2 TaxID=1198649 RepID=UPI003461DF5B
MKKIVIVLCLLATFPLFALGNAEMGKEKSAVCAACHGQNGISANPLWPNLAGQHATYTLQQLQDYKDGKARNNPSMAGMVANLSPEDMADLAAFYQQQPIAEGVASKENLKRGEILYRGGDFKNHITACIACHGPKGLGNAEAKFPVVSGQHAQYTVEQLQAFKEGKRKNDLNAIMRDIASHMSKEDMEAVANYMQGLH